MSLNFSNTTTTSKKAPYSAIEASGSEVVTTLQGNFISLHSCETMQCLWSASLPPKHEPFHCPSIKAGSNIYGIYGKKLYSWTTILNQTPESIEVLEQVTQLIPLEDVGVIVVFQNGSIDLYNYELKLLKGWRSPATCEVLYVTATESESGSTSLSFVIRNESIASQRKMIVSTSSVLLLEDTVFDLEDDYLSFSIGSNQIIHVVYKSRQLHIIDPKGESFKISLAKFMDEKKPSVAQVAIKNNCHALISQKMEQDYVTIWDSKYGTLQLEKAIAEVTPSVDIRTFTIKNTTSTQYGDILVTSTARKGLAYFSMVPYHCPKVTMLTALGKLSGKDPIFDPSTLQGQITSPLVVDIPDSKENTKAMLRWKTALAKAEHLDSVYLAKLLSVEETPSISSFQAIFIEWMVTKQDISKLLRAGKETTDYVFQVDTVNTKNLSRVGKAEFNPHVIEALLERCLRDSEKFWPRPIVEYLVMSGSINSAMVHGTLLQTLIKKQDLKMIQKILKAILDLDESDKVEIMKFILDADEDSLVPGLCSDWWNKKQLKAGPAADVIISSTYAGSLNEGQCQMLHIMFSKHRVDSVFKGALSALSEKHLYLLFEWVKGVIGPEYDEDLYSDKMDQKSPCWWLWGSAKEDDSWTTDTATEYSAWINAVEAFGLVIDAHLSTIRLSTELQNIVSELSVVIKRDLQLFFLYEDKLRGPLMGTVGEIAAAYRLKARKVTTVPSRHGRNWLNLVDQMDIGVGEYAIEALIL